MRRAIPLVALLFLAAASCAKRPEPAEEEIEAIEIGHGEVNSDDCEYARCDEPEADFVLLVEFFGPDRGAPSRHRFPLKFNPNGKNQGVGSTSNHWCGCGGGGGENGSV